MTTPNRLSGSRQPEESDLPMTHVLLDLLRPGLRVVFCGTAAGAVSAAKGAYYAGPGNRFWPMLAKTGLTPRQLRRTSSRCCSASASA